MQFEYTITDDLGLHARPASLLVKTAMKYPCQVTIMKDDKSGNMKQIFSIMKMGVKCGDTVTIICEGEKEEEAMEEIKEVFCQNL